MLNKKEIQLYKAIKNYIKVHKCSPSIRELCIILNYKSTKTIYKYLKILNEKNYISYQKNKKRTIIINNSINENVMVINTKKTINIIFNEEMLIYQIKNNYFNDLFIKSNDYLIIKRSTKIKNNELGLFYINNTYRIMKYMYYDGYHILEDNEKEILSKINLIGIVIGIYRIK